MKEKKRKEKKRKENTTQHNTTQHVSGPLGPNNQKQVTGQAWELEFSWDPESTATQKFSSHPGGELSAMPHWALSQSNTSIAWAQPGPFICSGSVSARPIRARRRGPLKRALYIRTNHRGPSILVTENVPTLSISPPNVPTLVMFGL